LLCRHCSASDLETVFSSCDIENTQNDHKFRCSVDDASRISKIQSEVEFLQFDHEEDNWLRMSSWNKSKENMILVHGYAGGDDVLPMSILRDAYLTHGGYNVFVVDWSKLSPPPC
jgi:hypothetical protein